MTGPAVSRTGPETLAPTPVAAQPGVIRSREHDDRLVTVVLQCRNHAHEGTASEGSGRLAGELAAKCAIGGNPMAGIRPANLVSGTPMTGSEFTTTRRTVVTAAGR